jgi:hypothetical protein
VDLGRKIAPILALAAVIGGEDEQMVIGADHSVDAAKPLLTPAVVASKLISVSPSSSKSGWS